jgi:phage gpG-like protein
MKNLGDLSSDFKSVTEKMKKLHENELLKYIGVEGVKLTHENFNEQGYDSGEGKEDWKERPEWVNKVYDTNPSYRGSVVKGSNPIAQQTGKLYRSIEHQEFGNKVLIGVNTNTVPYAAKINEGGTSFWKEIGRTITVIPRKFLPVNGEPINPKLVDRAKKKYEQRINDIMENYK